jgi:hypothetical protein
MKTRYLYPLAILFFFAMGYEALNAHCDMMEGPVIKDAQKAIETNNVNYVLKWVAPEGEKEVNEAFKLSIKVRDLSPEAKILSEKYFFETLVRIHLQSEGKSFSGVKPKGTPIDEVILAADKSIETGSMSQLENMVANGKLKELKKLFDIVLELSKYDVNDLPAAREYVESYVKFFHYAEGSDETHKCNHD